MSQRMGWRAAAKQLGISQNAMYQAIKQGTMPVWRCGAAGKRGRYICDIELCEQAITKIMMKNVDAGEGGPPIGIRRVK
jgi:hypothetical protein